MAILKDCKGTEWNLKLSLSAIRSICSKLNISMAQLTMLDLPIGDILGSVHMLCAKQLKSEGITEEEFYELIDEVPFDDLIEILQETFYDAFPKMKPAEGEDTGPFVHGE